jgi:hypothetical protein
MKKMMLSLIAAATVATGFGAVPAAAQYYDHDDRYYDRDDRDYYDRRDYRRDRRDYRRSRDYDRRDYRRGDYDNGYRCRSGTTGAVVGGAAGVLIGREVAGRRGDRTAGAVIGGAIGVLTGRAIERNGNTCRR